MADKNLIGFVFLEKFADWEFGLLSGSATEWFGARTVVLSPSKNSVSSLGGLRLMRDRGINNEENEDLDALVVIGSDTWAHEDAPDIGSLLNSILLRSGVIGGICGGTLALARAGIFKERRHTSNSAGWIESKIGEYAGSSFYQDVPFAIRDTHVISAPGSASGTFTINFLEVLFPEQQKQISQMHALIAREYKTV